MVVQARIRCACNSKTKWWTLAGAQLTATDHYELEWRYGQHLQHCQWPNATGQLELWEQPGPAPAQFDQQAV